MSPVANLFRTLLAVTAAVVLGHLHPAPANSAEEEGVKVPRRSMFRNLVSADAVEQSALVQYNQMTRQAMMKGKLLPADDPAVRRVRRIAADLLPHTQ